MRKIVLERFAKTAHGVLGRLGEFCTLEEQDLGNRPNVSCIPPGVYTCVRTRYNRGGYETFEVTNVPRRSHILFHRGNTEEDTDGCILLGRNFNVLTVRDEGSGQIMPKIATIESTAAFADFMRRLEGVDRFQLTILER